MASRVIVRLARRGRALGKVLDVGCGTGQVLLAASKEATSLAGTDLDRVSIDLARHLLPGASFAVESVETAPPFPGLRFDTIFFCDVIEHLSRPFEALCNLRAALDERGLLVVTTPNVSAVARTVLGDSWFGLSDESHLMLYTGFTLKHLLKKAGFTRIWASTIAGTGNWALDAALQVARQGGTLLACADSRAVPLADGQVR